MSIEISSFTRIRDIRLLDIYPVLFATGFINLQVPLWIEYNRPFLHMWYLENPSIGILLMYFLFISLFIFLYLLLEYFRVIFYLYMLIFLMLFHVLFYWKIGFEHFSIIISRIKGSSSAIDLPITKSISISRSSIWKPK